MGTTYEQWVSTLGVPVYKGYHIEELKTLSLGLWEKRRCPTAFLLLAGQEGIGETRITEIPPGETLPPWNFALDEIVYVAEGQGLTTVWDAQKKNYKTFEWQKHSLFLLPRLCPRQLGNVQGNKSAKLLHFNFLPLALQTVDDPDFFLDNAYLPTSTSPQSPQELERLYSKAIAVVENTLERGRTYAAPDNRDRIIWHGNFFPDMAVWDKSNPLKGRGGAGHVVEIQFTNSPLFAHMSIFAAKTYKKAHRHGPAFTIVIPAGEGYSIMWEEGKEKIVVPWHESSVFVPPNRWFHQHFNTGAEQARYLAIHPPPILEGLSKSAEDLARDQIEYPDEDPWIRQRFEDALTAKGLRSLMPEKAYADRNFDWEYA